jgi:hypothetical protein
MDCLKASPDICKQERKKNLFGSAYSLTDWVHYNTLLAHYRLVTVSVGNIIVGCEGNNRGLFKRTIFEIYGRETPDLQFVPDSDADDASTVASLRKSVD